MWQLLPLLLALLTGSYTGDGFKVLQISDFHYDAEYDVHGDPAKMCHKSRANRVVTAQLGDYGDYMCDSPESLVRFAISEAHRILPEPDLLLWTGDNVPHIDQYDWSYVHRALNVTTTALFETFSKAPRILPTFGNHDYAPANAFVNGSSLYIDIYEIWKDRIGADKETEVTFKKGGYYKYALGNATVLVLNTNLYYTGNAAYDNFTDKKDPADQFAFMENELQAAADCAAKPQPTTCASVIHIAAHIAPGAFERAPNVTWFRPEYNQRFLGLVANYSTNIGWLLFGHHHTDTFHIVRDATGKPVQLLLMSPAVTPWFSTLDGAGANNPAFRIYETPSASDVYTKISTYSVNLDNLNKEGGKAHFEVEYEFTTAYGLTEGINGRTMDDLIDRMYHNESLFRDYIRFNSVGWKPKEPVGEFRAAQFCSLQYADLDAYYACLDQEMPFSSSVSPSGLVETTTAAQTTVTPEGTTSVSQQLLFFPSLSILILSLYLKYAFQ